jgi:hypothetical protein
MINKYFTKIKHAVDAFDTLTPVIYNVVPPVQKYNTAENPEYPYLGTDDERKVYVMYFNEKLQQKCVEFNYLFLNIYDKYVDDNGFLNKNLSDGNVHIRDEIYLKQFIQTRLSHIIEKS